MRGGKYTATRAHLDDQAWIIRKIENAVAEAEAGGPFEPHEKIMRRLKKKLQSKVRG